MLYPVLNNCFFDQDSIEVSRKLLGKILCVKLQDTWLYAKIIETEAYTIEDKASHASLGYTEKRKALFMPAGTIYMYYARGADSLNVSVRGEGCAVLIKAAFPHLDHQTPENMISQMQQLNPKSDGTYRPIEKLCSGQTLLCKSLNLKVKDWDQKPFDQEYFYIGESDYQPTQIIQTTRLGIPQGRDGHLPYRFIDHDFAKFCTKNPLTQRTKNFTITG